MKSDFLDFGRVAVRSILFSCAFCLLCAVFCLCGCRKNPPKEKILISIMVEEDSAGSGYDVHEVVAGLAKNFAEDCKDADISFSVKKADADSLRKSLQKADENADADLIFCGADTLASADSDAISSIILCKSEKAFLCYDKDLFRKCGLDEFIADDAVNGGKNGVQRWTLAEWQKILVTLAKELPENVYPFGFGSGDSFCNPMIFALIESRGCSVFDADGKVDLSDQKALDALEWLKISCDQGFFPPDADELTFEQCLALCRENRVAIGPCAGKGDYGLVEYPAADADKSVTPVKSLVCVLRGSSAFCSDFGEFASDSLQASDKSENVSVTETEFARNLRVSRSSLYRIASDLLTGFKTPAQSAATISESI